MVSSGMPAGGTSWFSMPGARAQPADAPAAALHLARHGQPGDDVPAGAGGHDDEVRSAHGVLFWLRHATLRALHIAARCDPAPPARTPWLMAFMRGLRA
jgi:hypothetical protein